MTTNHHTVIATGAAANASVFNAPLAQLDAQITTNATAIDGLETSVTLLQNTVILGGAAVTLTDGAADAAQKVVTVDSSAQFVAGAYVEYLLVGGVLERNTVDTVDSGTQLTLITNIGTGGIADNSPVAVIPLGFYNSQAGVFNILNYGASPSASAAVNTAAIQAAINALAIEATASTGTYAGTILFPPGVYEINDTLTFQSLRGFKLSGTGGASRIVWTANADTKAVIDILDCRNSTIENLTISVSGGAGAGALACIRLAGTVADGVPRFNHFSDLFLDYGLHNIYIGGTSSIDANNDFMQFENVEFNNYTTSGVYKSAQSQAYNYIFLNCQWEGASVAGYAVDGGANVTGGFTVIGGIASGHTVAAFRIPRSVQPTLLMNMQEEGNAKFLVAEGDHTSVTIRGCRLACNAVGADKTMIDFGGANSILTIEDCTIGDGASPTAALKVADVKFGDSVNAQKWGRFVFNRNTIFSTLTGSADDDMPFEVSGASNILPTEAEGNLVIADVSQMVAVRLDITHRATEYYNASFMQYHGAAKVIRARTTGAVIDYGTFDSVPPYHTFTVICDGTNTFYNHATATYGDNLYLSGNADVTMTDGSSITFYHDYDNDRFIEIARSKH